MWKSERPLQATYKRALLQPVGHLKFRFLVKNLSFWRIEVSESRICQVQNESMGFQASFVSIYLFVIFIDDVKAYAWFQLFCLEISSRGFKGAGN